MNPMDSVGNQRQSDIFLCEETQNILRCLHNSYHHKDEESHVRNTNRTFL